MEPAAPRPQAGTRGDSPTAVGKRGSEGGSAAYGWHAIKRERETGRERGLKVHAIERERETERERGLKVKGIKESEKRRGSGA